MRMATKDLAGIVVINLTRRRDRLRAVMTELLNSDLANVKVHRLPAHDGRENDWSHLLSCRARAEVKDVERTKIRQHHSQLTKGGIGCYLSHVDAWRWVADQGKLTGDMDSPYLILEDDVGIPPMAKSALRLGWYLARKQVGSAPLIMLMQVVCLEGCKKQDNGLLNPDKFWGLQASVINPRDALELLKTDLFPIDVQVDFKLRYLRDEGRLNVLVFHEFSKSKVIADTDIQADIVPEAPIDRP